MTDGLHRMVLALADNAEVLVTDLQDEGDSVNADHRPRSRTSFTLRGVKNVTGLSHLFSHRLNANIWTEPQSVSEVGHAGEWKVRVGWPMDVTTWSDSVHAHLTAVAAQLGALLEDLRTEAVSETPSASTPLVDSKEEDDAEDEGGLNPRIAALLPELAADPAFDPITYDGDMEEFVRSRVDAESDAFIAEVAFELLNYATYSGLQEAAEQELGKQALQILDAMPATIRDKYGFASRSAIKDKIIEPFLPDVRGLRRGRLQRHIRWAEEENYATTREARYATAARRLLNRRETKTATSAALGISTAVMDRLLRTYPDDVVIPGDDPLSGVLGT